MATTITTMAGHYAAAITALENVSTDVYDETNGILADANIAAFTETDQAIVAQAATIAAEALARLEMHDTLIGLQNIEDGTL